MPAKYLFDKKKNDVKAGEKPLQHRKSEICISFYGHVIPTSTKAYSNFYTNNHPHNMKTIYMYYKLL